MRKSFQVLTLLSCLVGSACGKGCFVGSTLVSMADGTVKRIEDIEEGEMVVSWDETTDTLVNATVKGLISFHRKELMLVRTSSGKEITSTVDHPFYSLRTRSIVSLDPESTRQEYQLDQVLSLDGSKEVLADIFGEPVRAEATRLPEERNLTKTFTLCLDAFHWYYVEGVRVHNKGCFASDTGVLMASGNKKHIQDIKAGDEVVSWDDELERFVNVTVQGLLRFQRKELMRLQLGEQKTTILATPDHPFWSTRMNGLVSLDALATKAFYQVDASHLEPSREFFHGHQGVSIHGWVSDVLLLDEETEVFTLCLPGPHWFFVGEHQEFVRVHNKGCFVGSTRVLLENGIEQEISSIRPGQMVQSWRLGQPVRAKVVSVLAYQREQLVRLSLKDDAGFTTREILATPDHPFWSPRLQSEASFDPIKTKVFYEMQLVGRLLPVDVLQTHDGSLVNVSLEQTIKLEEPETVYTLQLEKDHYFFAESVLVHNKGSFGGSSSSGSSWGSSSSSSSYGSYGYNSNSGYYSYGGSRYTSIIIYRSSYYSSPTCRSDPYRPGCAQGSQSVVCGCPEGTVPGVADYEDWENGSDGDTKNSWGFEYCSAEAEAGVCISKNVNSKCIPERFENITSANATAFSMVVSAVNEFCPESYASCLNEGNCGALLSNPIFQKSLYRNADNFNNPTAKALANCVKEKVPICSCSWETCTEKEMSPLVAIGIVLAIVTAGVVICCCVGYVCCRKQNRMVVAPGPNTGPQHHQLHPKIATCLQDPLHVYIQKAPREIAMETGDRSYLEGFYCDCCGAGFPPTITLHRCYTCRVDFCGGCSQKKIPVQMVPASGDGPAMIPAAVVPQQISTVETCINQRHEKVRVIGRDLGVNYQNGFSCDKCKGIFPPDVTFSHCKQCGLDLCDGCYNPLSQ